MEQGAGVDPADLGAWADCAAVIANINDPRHEAHPRNTMAETWRMIPRDQWFECSKIKKHRPCKKAIEQGDYVEWKGNAEADSCANIAALYGVPTAWQKQVEARNKIKALVEEGELAWSEYLYTGLI